MSRTLCLLVVVAGLLMMGAPRAALAEESAGDGNPRFTYEYMVKCFAPRPATVFRCAAKFGKENTYVCPDFEKNRGKAGRRLWYEGCFLNWLNELGRDGWQLADQSVNRVHLGHGGPFYPYNFIRIRVWGAKGEPNPAPEE